MISPGEILSILISIKVEKNEVLFIVLSSDGSINRKGNGSPDCKDKDLYIGLTDNTIIEELKESITAGMLEFLHKTFDAPDKKGRNCDLKILYRTNNVETGVQFLYGEHSQGPPREFSDFVRKAVSLTDSWHATQKGISVQPESLSTPWWKFW